MRPSRREDPPGSPAQEPPHPAGQPAAVAHRRQRQREARDDDEHGDGHVAVEQPPEPPRAGVVREARPGREPDVVKDDEHRGRPADAVEPGNAAARPAAARHRCGSRGHGAISAGGCAAITHRSSGAPPARAGGRFRLRGGGARRSAPVAYRWLRRPGSRPPRSLRCRCRARCRCRSWSARRSSRPAAVPRWSRARCSPGG